MERIQDSPISIQTRVNNAGLVLLHAWFPALFERSGLVREQRFASAAAQAQAVNFLQFLASGEDQAPEHLVVLNKIFCGLPPSASVDDFAPLSEQDKALCSSLIASAIEHWSVIGKTSVAGFRGNWLIRDGILREASDRWNLIVQQRPYDVLLIRAPFAFSIVMYPWMDKPIHVSWRY